ncbi:hypothetical protein N6L27_15810 [Leisingera sp. SS27]|uniref:hypothetical protein n=1 Tax=Leisingera sp. SS27 TaxID=2979462 RepID=UPI00232D741A|nr:hypothetical protein [Leisingera sp. SS27]MDC0659467.1 hypothetical protein [Leisingera sp. SS27]
MISATSNATAAPSLPAQEEAGVPGIAKNFSETLKGYERHISGDIEKSLEPGSAILKLPQHVQDQFKKWDDQFTDPETRALMEAVKKKIIEMHNSNTDYIRDKVKSNADKIKIEFAIKAISKTTNGIQQILSAQ